MSTQENGFSKTGSMSNLLPPPSHKSLALGRSRSKLFQITKDNSEAKSASSSKNKLHDESNITSQIGSHSYLSPSEDDLDTKKTKSRSHSTKTTSTKNKDMFEQDPIDELVSLKINDNSFAPPSTKLVQSQISLPASNRQSSFGRSPSRLISVPNNIKEAISPMVRNHNEQRSPSYNYSSANYSSLIYIPEDFLKATPKNHRTTFTSFNDISRNQKISDALEEIIHEETYKGYSIDKEFQAKQNLSLINRKLSFNKSQKNMYYDIMQEKMRSTFLPLIDYERMNKEKMSLMPKVKSYPSRRLILHNPTSNNKTEYNLDDRPELIDIRNQKVEYGAKYEEAHLDENLTFNYNFFWYSLPNDDISWKPSGREGCIITSVGKYIVMYGGLSNNVLDDMTLYDPAKKVWTKQKTSGEMPFYGRQGHTALEYRKSVIIFGGEKQFNENIKMRECLNDTRTYNPEKNEWKFLKCVGKVLEPRRSHSASIHDKIMYVYGGISQYSHCLSDLWSLNLKTYTWNEILFESDRQEKGIAHHAMCAVYNEIKNDKNRRAAVEGLYVFGGKSADGMILNTLKILLTYQKPYRWYYPGVKGALPAARFKHTMVHYPALGILIVYGGRNDNLYETQGTFCLKDIRVLSLELMSWCPAVNYGDGPTIPRCSHAATIFGNQMMIFGGVSDSEYADSAMIVLELNQASSRRLIREFQFENNQNEIERRMMLERIIMDKIRDTENQETDSPTFFIGATKNRDTDGEVEKKCTPSFLPVPNLRHHDVETEQKKLRDELKNHVSKNRTQSLLMQVTGGFSQSQTNSPKMPRSPLLSTNSSFTHKHRRNNSSTLNLTSLFSKPF